MTESANNKDLVILVADRNMEYAIKGLLGRTKAFIIREVTSEIYVHPGHDSGCLLHGCDFLRPFVNQYNHALIVLDHEGCGQEEKTRIELEKNIETQLAASGWNDRAAAIVIEPELENWVWSDSPHVDSVLGWQGIMPDLKTWLTSKGFLNDSLCKPKHPKKAMEEALRKTQKARSSAIFLHLAQKVSIDRCNDPAFLKLKKTLSAWFPERPC